MLGDTKLTLKEKRHQARVYGAVGPLVRSFLPPGRSRSVIYAVTLKEHLGITKVGRTANWRNRRAQYAKWNLATEDAVDREAVFTMTDEFVDLVRLEAFILQVLPFPRRSGNEWFVAEIDEVSQAIERILADHALSYVGGETIPRPGKTAPIG